MQAVIGLAMLAQIVGAPAYTYVDAGGVVLATDTGRYRLDLGAGCEGYDVPENVTVSAGSGGVASISVPTAEFWCNVFIDDPVSDMPCAVNADGVCDIDAEQQ